MKKQAVSLLLLISSLAQADLTNLSSWIYDSSGNAINLGQTTMGNGLPVSLASNQSAIPVSQSGAWTNACTQSGTWNVGLSTGSNLVGKVGIDQTTPGTTNGVQVNAALPVGTNSIGQITANAGTNLNTSALALSANQTNASQKTQIVDGSGNVVGPVTTISSVNYAPVTRPAGSLSGTLTAACLTGISCAAGSVVTLTVPEGQSAWDIYLSGTFSAASQVAFEGTTDPTGASDWFYLNGRRNTDSTTNDTTTLLDVTPFGGTPPMGGNPSNWRGNIAGIKFLRVRCMVYTASDSISVRMTTAAADGAVFINAALPLPADKSNNGTITALNGAVTASTTGASTVVFSVTGTWVGTLFFQGQNQDGTFAYLYANSVSFGTDFDAQSTTTNGTYIVATGGFSNVRIVAQAFISGTVLVGWNAGAGTKILKVFQPNPSSFNATIQGSGTAGSPNANVVTVQGISSGTVIPANVSQLGGNAINTGAGATGTGTARVASNAYDGSGNAETSTTISGTAANKQPADVTPLSSGTARYYTAFATQQTAATAANATIFSMRNAAAATKTAIVENIYCREGFNGTNPITRTQQTYGFQRYNSATPTTGTALTAGQGDSSDGASQVTDIRFLDTGLSTTSVVFSGNNLAIMACDATQGITCQQPQLVAPAGWKLAPGEGLALRLGVVAVAGVSISCTIGWREQ